MKRRRSRPDPDQMIRGNDIAIISFLAFLVIVLVGPMNLLTYVS